MKIEIDNSFGRDAKKLPDSVRDELRIIYEAIENADTLANLTYSVKKMEGRPKLKAFRIKLAEHSDFRIGFYLENDTVILSRILNRKDIHKKFLPKK